MKFERRNVRHQGAWKIALPLAAVVCGAAWAADVPAQDDADEEKPPIVVPLKETVVVEREALSHDTTFVQRDELEAARTYNLALALETLPGVSGVRRNQNYIEPVIRGLGWERVQTQLNGMPLHGACPGRMDPPACIVSGGSVERADVIKGLASVSHGPAGTGGRLEVSTDYDRGTGASRELHPWFRTSYDGSRDGFTAAAGAEGGTENADVRFGLEHLDHENYDSAGGVEVPALHEESGGFISLGVRPARDQRLNAGLVYRDEGRTDYPALPMDTDDTTSTLFNVGWSMGLRDGALANVEIRSGYADIDHLMSNRYKPNRGVMEAETTGAATSASLGLATTWRASNDVRIAAGADFSVLERDSLRSRRMVMTGMTSLDHLWPDVTQQDIGVYTEATIDRPRGWRIRLGARLDDVDSDAAAADDPALGGMTIREAYVFYYGANAADVDRSERLVSGNALFSKRLGPNWDIQGGAGVVRRAAGVTERYFAFAPAPNGFVVGNPSLEAESKVEASLGVTHNGVRSSTNVTLFHYDVADYIYQSVLDVRDVNGDGLDDTIRGFSNVDATLVGGEVSTLIRPGRHWLFPVSVAWTRGTNDETNGPLPEIPAVEAVAAGRYRFEGRFPGSVELGGRFVGRQDRVDAAFGEDETPGYSVWHLRGVVRVAGAVQLELGVENLFDKDYHEHLTREAVMPGAGLLLGDEVPQPGRAIQLGIRAVF